VQRYGYDPLYRLTEWISPSRQMVRYAYDAVGNRLSMVAPTGATSYTYDAADELLTAGGGTFTYDGNGNQASKTTAGTTLTYGWDALNRLISVTGGGVNTQYQYAGDGNRVSQQTSAGTYAYVNDTATTLPVVVNESGPDGNISYAYGNSLISASATGLQSFYQFDGLGSVSTVTDQSTSQKASYSYDPWGNALGNVDSLSSKNKYKFTGEALDTNTGLVFLRGRYYDQTIGRFLSKDPLLAIGHTSAVGSNSYEYGFANPLRYADPSGLSAIDRIGALAASTGLPPIAASTGPCDIFGCDSAVLFAVDKVGGKAVGKETAVAGVVLEGIQCAREANSNLGVCSGRVGIEAGVGAVGLWAVAAGTGPVGVVAGAGVALYTGASILFPDQVSAAKNFLLNSIGDAVGSFVYWAFYPQYAESN
jgi:RHS repeat-associated protein